MPLRMGRGTPGARVLSHKEGLLRRAFPLPGSNPRSQHSGRTLAVSREAISTARPESAIVSPVLVYAIIDLRSSPDHPLGDAVETFVRREDAERFIEEVRGDDPDLTSYLRVEERGLR